MPTLVKTIGAPVGAKGVNRHDDVMLVQELLNAAIKAEPKLKGMPALETDGHCGPKTVAAILAYQEKVLGWKQPAADATISPGRATWRSLNGNIGGVCEAPPAGVMVVDGYRMYRQGQYSGKQLGSGDGTISAQGCALCTLTMAATGIGARTNHWPKDLQPQALDPLEANTIVKAAGGFSGSLLAMPKAAEALGMNFTEVISTPHTVGAVLARLRNHMSFGYPVAAHVDYKRDDAAGDHWILLTARQSDGTYRGIDPATGKQVKLTESPQSSVTDVATPRTTAIAKGVLFGWGQGGSSNQSNYVLVRFGMLSPGAAGLST